MSQSAPRKFSEKIAILERKQNEEEELFHHVMRDVRAITGSNVRSSATPTETACASSTGYPKNTGIQNNAGTSGVQQMQQMSDPNTLSLNWNRSGGSLPNVHSIVQQQLAAGNYTNMNYWAQVPPTTQNSHIRTRSPGAHYHPYSNRGSMNPRQNEKLMQMEHNHIDPNTHLQLPNTSWSKARSDPAIHSNIVNMGQTFDPSRTFCQPTAAQMWNTQNYRTSHLTPINSSQSQFIPFAPGCSGYNSQLYGQFQMAAPLQQQHQTSQNQVQCLPSDMSIGSLPNMHASSQPHPGKIIMPTTFENVPSCYPTSASVSASDNNEVVVQQQLSTPSLYNQSQSAPTSPAQIKDIPSPLRQQWMTNRHYSVSPEILDVPNICVTGTDGNESLDCFQDLQDLHLDNEIRRLLHDPNDEQVDPITESNLLI